MSREKSDKYAPALSEKTFDCGPVKLNYAEGEPNGPPFVFVHGLGRRWQVILPLLKPFLSQWHVFAPDLRGHGKSTHIPRGYRGVEYAGDIARFLSGTVKTPAVFFGHSLGGMIGMWIAAHHPELIRALIVGDSIISQQNFAASMYPQLFSGLCNVARRGGSLEQIAAGLAKIEIQMPGLTELVPIGDLPGNTPGYLLAWARCVKQVDPDTYAMSVDGSSLEDWDGESLLASIRCPTLLLQANPELGGLMSDQDVQLGLKLLARPSHVMFPTLGHALYMQQAQPVLEAVTNFLNGLGEKTRNAAL